MFLAGTLLAATSCIENDEPQGLQEMRQAKAELMQANAVVLLAEAELRKAEAVAKEAEARITSAQAEALEIANAIQSARNDAEKEELKLKLERLAEQQKADLAELKASTVSWEAAYEKALIDLEAALATYRNSKYAGELQSVLGKLTSIRGQIVNKQVELIAYVTRDSLTANRRIRTAVTTAQKDYDLGVEKVELLKKAKESNILQWGQTRDEMSARMEALATKWQEATPQYLQLQNKVREITREFYAQQFMIDGNSYYYYNSMYNHSLEPDPTLDPMQKIAFAVPASLQTKFEYQFSSFEKENDSDIYYREIAGLSNALQTLLYAYDNTTGDYYYDEFPENLQQFGVIPTLRQWILSDNDIAHATQMKMQYEKKSEAAKKAYEEQLRDYKILREKYIAAAEAYGYDWTQVNNSVEQHLWYSTRKAVDSYYLDYDNKLAKDPLYAPTEAELKTVAAQIANYLKKRVALTSEYWLDPLVVLDPLKPEETMRLSSALIATGTEADDYRKQYLITAGSGRNVMGNSENLTWNVDNKPDQLHYDWLLSDLASSISSIYGLYYYSSAIPLMLIDLDPTDDLTVELTLQNANYTQITPNNYDVKLNNPIHNLPVTEPNYYMSLEILSRGSLYDYLTIQAACADLTALIDSQADILTLIDGAEKTRATLLSAYQTAFALQGALNEEMWKVDIEYQDFIYNNRLELDQFGWPISSNLSLAEQEFLYYSNMYDLLDSYINNADIVLSDGSEYDVNSDIDDAIEQAEKAIDETTPDGLYEKLEQAKANLSVWEDFGYDGVAAAIGDQIRAEIADMQAELAEAQAEFERDTELKNQLIALMKAE